MLAFKAICFVLIIVGMAGAHGKTSNAQPARCDNQGFYGIGQLYPDAVDKQGAAIGKPVKAILRVVAGRTIGYIDVLSNGHQYFARRGVGNGLSADELAKLDRFLHAAVPSSVNNADIDYVLTRGTVPPYIPIKNALKGASIANLSIRKCLP